MFDGPRTQASVPRSKAPVADRGSPPSDANPHLVLARVSDAWANDGRSRLTSHLRGRGDKLTRPAAALIRRFLCALWPSVRRRSLEPLAFSRTDSLPREPDAGQDPPDGGCGQLAHGSRSARPACSVRDRLNRSRRCDSRSAAAEQIAFGPRSSRCRCPIRRRRRNDPPSDHLREEKHTHACQEGRIKHVRD